MILVGVFPSSKVLITPDEGEGVGVVVGVCVGVGVDVGVCVGVGVGVDVGVCVGVGVDVGVCVGVGVIEGAVPSPVITIRFPPPL